MLPFEALYQDALSQVAAHEGGITGLLIQLGPFGGAYVTGWGVRLWSIAYLALVAIVSLLAFARRDL